MLFFISQFCFFQAFFINLSLSIVLEDMSVMQTNT